MSETKCKCGKPTSGAYLCDRCVKTLDVAFANVGVYYDDLETLRTKRTRYGSGTATKGSIGKAQPLGMDARFARSEIGSEVDHDTRNTVVSWSRTIMEEQPELSGPYCRHACLHTSCAGIFRRRFPRDTVKSMTAYLQRQLRYVVGERWAEDILDEFLDLERRLSRLVDRPADRWYAGKCSTLIDEQECDAELYAQAEQGYIKCPKCGDEHNVSTRREFLLREAQEILVTATEAAGALLAWTDYDGSEEKLVDRIRKWEDRGKLDARGHIHLYGRDRSLYRLGDVQDLMVRHAQSEQSKQLSRSA